MWERWCKRNLKPTGAFWRRTCAASGSAGLGRNLAGADGGRRGAATPGRSRNRGFSMGGYVALALAEKASRTCRGQPGIDQFAGGGRYRGSAAGAPGDDRKSAQGRHARSGGRGGPEIVRDRREELSRYALKGGTRRCRGKHRGRWRRWRGGRTAHRCCGNSASPSSSCTARRTNLFLRRARATRHEFESEIRRD